MEPPPKFSSFKPKYDQDQPHEPERRRHKHDTSSRPHSSQSDLYQWTIDKRPDSRLVYGPHGGVRYELATNQILGLSSNPLRSTNSERQLAALSYTPPSLSSDLPGFISFDSSADMLDAESVHSSSERLDSQHGPHDLRARHQALQNQTKSCPHNAQVWLDFAFLQDEWVASGFTSTGTNKTSSGRVSRRDMLTASRLKTKILEDAMNSVSADDPQIADIITSLMAEYAKIISPEEVLHKWKTFAHAQADSALVWAKYLSYMINDGAREIALESCEEEFNKHLHDLAHAAPPAPPFHVLETFVGLTKLISTAGYCERAVALWQAFIEIQFFKPQDLVTGGASQAQLSQKFKKFWESECPRVGEPDAPGWLRSKRIAQKASRLSHPCLNDEHEAMSVLTKWAMIEIAAESQGQMPKRIIESNARGDPFDVVMFSDIEPFFELFAMQFPPQLVINAFLRFCQLPELSSTETDDKTAEDVGGISQILPFVKLNDFHHASQATFTLTSQTHNTSQMLAISRRFHNLRTNTRSLFTKERSPFAAFRAPSTELVYPPEFVQNTLELLTSALPSDDNVAEYCIAFGAAYSPGKAKVFTKTLMKERSSNLRLWNAAVLFKSRVGDHDGAARDCKTIIDIVPKLGTPTRKDAVFLHLTYIWQAFMSDWVSSALNCLLSFLGKDDETDGNEYLAQAKTVLQNNASAALREESFTHFMAYIECLALLAYLWPIAQATDEESKRPLLTESLSIYVDAIRDAENQGHLHLIELIYQTASAQVYYHVTAYGRAMDSVSFHNLLGFLQQGLARFPNNTAINTAFEAVAPKTERVRALLRSSVAQPSTVSAWATAISNEMARGTELGVTSAAVRSLFEKATNSDCGKNNAALWAWWLEWEVDIAKSVGRQGKQRPKRMVEQPKNVWVMGYRALPFVKDWLVLGVGLLGDGFKIDEVAGFYDALADHGVRFYKDVHDVLEQD